MPVEPISYVTVICIVLIFGLNLLLWIEPKWDRYQERRRRTRRTQAAIRIGLNSFENFMKIAFLLNEVVLDRNHAYFLFFSRIQASTIVYQGYPELLVPAPDYVIALQYRVDRVEKKVHVQTETDHNGQVIAFNVLAMSNQTNGELFQYLSALPPAQRLA